MPAAVASSRSSHVRSGDAQSVRRRRELRSANGLTRPKGRPPGRGGRCGMSKFGGFFLGEPSSMAYPRFNAIKATASPEAVRKIRSGERLIGFRGRRSRGVRGHKRAEPPSWCALGYRGGRQTGDAGPNDEAPERTLRGPRPRAATREHTDVSQHAADDEYQLCRRGAWVVKTWRRLRRDIRIPQS